MSHTKTTLKELTWDLHTQAEKTPLMNSLLKNEIEAGLYCQMVYTKFVMYSVIEEKIKFQTTGLSRAPSALQDWHEMGCDMPRCLSQFTKYMDYLRTLNTHQLWPHVYVHYLAPLYGGQIIKKVVGGRFPTRIYDFPDAEAAKMEIRERLTLDMASEANKSFEMTIAYYDELYESYHK